MVSRVRAYLGLGANLGDREAGIRHALALLGAIDGIEVARVSSLVETDPVGGPEGQPRYINAVAAIDTELAPRELLRACLEVETALGRTRAERWGPRTIDVDVLLYGEEVVGGDGLAIPHPRMHRRAFVLGPLAEIAPEARHPTLGATARELADGLARAAHAGKVPK